MILHCCWYCETTSGRLWVPKYETGIDVMELDLTLVVCRWRLIQGSLWDVEIAFYHNICTSFYFGCPDNLHEKKYENKRKYQKFRLEWGYYACCSRPQLRPPQINFYIGKYIQYTAFKLFPNINWQVVKKIQNEESVMTMLFKIFIYSGTHTHTHTKKVR